MRRDTILKRIRKIRNQLPELSTQNKSTKSKTQSGSESDSDDSSSSEEEPNSVQQQNADQQQTASKPKPVPKSKKGRKKRKNGNKDRISHLSNISSNVSERDQLLKSQKNQNKLKPAEMSGTQPAQR